MAPVQHCPGFEQFRYIKSLSFKCPICEKEEEIFSDEIGQHTCSMCKKDTDYNHYLQSEDFTTLDINRYSVK